MKGLTKKSQQRLRRLRVENRLLKRLKRILRDEPITEVVGKLDLGAAGRCCSDGTYAILKIDPGAVMRNK